MGWGAHAGRKVGRDEGADVLAQHRQPDDNVILRVLELLDKQQPAALWPFGSPAQARHALVPDEDALGPVLAELGALVEE